MAGEQRTVAETNLLCFPDISIALPPAATHHRVNIDNSDTEVMMRAKHDLVISTISILVVPGARLRLSLLLARITLPPAMKQNRAPGARTWIPTYRKVVVGVDHYVKARTNDNHLVIDRRR